MYSTIFFFNGKSTASDVKTKGQKAIFSPTADQQIAWHPALVAIRFAREFVDFNYIVALRSEY